MFSTNELPDKWGEDGLAPVFRTVNTIRFLFVALATFICLLATVWAVGAIYFDLPIALLRVPLAVIYAGATLAALILVKDRGRAVGVVAFCFILVLVWWSTLKPAEDRAWQPDVACRAWADIHGDEVTLHNVRNCEYRTKTDYTPRWETRVVHLSKLSGVDLAITYWGSPWIAHPIASFQFKGSLPVAISIETRKMIGQHYSALRGFYRQYELIFIPADERDVIRLRTNYRGEQVYLYHTTVSADRARAIFVEYLNQLHKKPEFYNAITDNCTTNIRVANIDAGGAIAPPWNWRILLNGKGDELLYERGIIDRSYPFSKLKARSLINPRANASGMSPHFSELIRVGLPRPNQR
jgi:hypothetical protein